MSKFELLAPAGSYESLVAAIKAGADAVYIGGQRFGARAYADNLEVDKMIEAIDYVHLHGKKLYMTVNTLLKPEEMDELYEYLLPYYKAGLDAVIVQDLGVLSFIKKHFPNLDIHASTQMNVVGVSAAMFLKKLGVKRVVTARELSLDEIRKIRQATGLEIESFVHGALCYCYSGQCLMSSILGGRSGNRGRCAQPCRLPYELRGRQAYYLSPKDMAAISILPKLMDAGIYSFKIEGRMKRAEYVAAVTSIYRKYIDLYEAGKEYKVSKEDEKTLLELYNRGGFHSGYYEQKNGKNMIAVDRPNHKGVFLGEIERISGNQVQFRTALPIERQDVLEIHTKDGGVELTSPVQAQKGEKVTLNAKKIKFIKKGQKIYRVKSPSLLEQIQENIIQKDLRVGIKGQVFAKVGKKLRIELSCGEISCKVEGDRIEEAKKNPMTKEQMISKIDQMRETDFYFENLQVNIEGNCFFPVSVLKKIRREALAKMREEILSLFRREAKPYDSSRHISSHTFMSGYDLQDKKAKIPSIVVSIMKREYLPLLLQKEEISSIYMELSRISFDEMKEITRSCKAAGKKIYYMMPYVFRENARKEYELYKKELFFGEHDGLLVRNIDSFAFLVGAPEYKKEIKIEYSLYCYNQEAIDFLSDMVEKISFTYPIELREKELKELVFPMADMICYSRFPLMISTQCVKKTMGCCNQKEEYLILKDRYEKEFIVGTECRYCYNLIYNGVPFSLLDCQKDIEEIAPDQLRLHFVEESIKEAEQIIDDFCRVYLRGKKEIKKQQKFTRGHFKRGIE